MLKLLLLILTTTFISACTDNKQISTTETLGKEAFSPKKWQNASQEIRATLLHSFLMQYDLKSLSTEQLISLLGPPTAYYEYDEIPAYFVGSEDISSMYGKGYLVAFPFDKSTGKIEHIVIIPEVNQ
ncbi:hypothetical protein [Marinomonas mediterranea]|uniref:hypothetical protein n=1 Tax=Marinomonas mediterranea TaxID=119864 RepID=UPI00234B9CD2|nr:hypothetical protein [Marinomonas mediterranea]WCN09007.1 hypothetical protein GV055_08765 [Marinomonas mediterranea]WCN13041.1 hypothetical protein GV054_08495 [Marinomonas mediterranea]